MGPSVHGSGAVLSRDELLAVKAAANAYCAAEHFGLLDADAFTAVIADLPAGAVDLFWCSVDDLHALMRVRDPCWALAYVNVKVVLARAVGE